MLKTLSQILKRAGNFDLVGTATDGCQALRSVSMLTPELVLMDMFEQHQNHVCQVATGLFSKAFRATANTERRLIEHEGGSAPQPNRPSDLNWKKLAIWSYAVFSFAALLFCVYIILAKCNGDWPF